MLVVNDGFENEMPAFSLYFHHIRSTLHELALNVGGGYKLCAVQLSHIQ